MWDKMVQFLHHSLILDFPLMEKHHFSPELGLIHVSKTTLQCLKTYYMSDLLKEDSITNMTDGENPQIRPHRMNRQHH